MSSNNNYINIQSFISKEKSSEVKNCKQKNTKDPSEIDEISQESKILGEASFKINKLETIESLQIEINNLSYIFSTNRGCLKESDFYNNKKEKPKIHIEEFCEENYNFNSNSQFSLESEYYSDLDSLKSERSVNRFTITSKNEENKENLKNKRVLCNFLNRVKKDFENEFKLRKRDKSIENFKKELKKVKSLDKNFNFMKKKELSILANIVTGRNKSRNKNEGNLKINLARKKKINKKKNFKKSETFKTLKMKDCSVEKSKKKNSMKKSSKSIRKSFEKFTNNKRLLLGYSNVNSTKRNSKSLQKGKSKKLNLKLKNLMKLNQKKQRSRSKSKKSGKLKFSKTFFMNKKSKIEPLKSSDFIVLRPHLTHSRISRRFNTKGKRNMEKISISRLCSSNKNFGNKNKGHSTHKKLKRSCANFIFNNN